jgi:hypothetical protein
MLKCLNKIIERIDKFDEDCSSLVFGLRHLLGEDQMVLPDQFLIKYDEDKKLLYKGSELILTESEDGMYVEPKFQNNHKLLKESIKALKEDACVGPLGGTPAAVDGQQLGGRSKKQLKENGGTSGADIATVPMVLGAKLKKKKKKMVKEGLVAGATLPVQDATVTISGGKGRVTKVAPSKASGTQKTLTVVDTGQ